METKRRVSSGTRTTDGGFRVLSFRALKNIGRRTGYDVVVLGGLTASIGMVALGISRTGFSGDAGWTWQTGRWILSHHGVPRTAIWSWWVPSAPWVDTEWLWQVVVAWWQAHFGFYGLEWLDMAIWVALGLLLWKGWQRWVRGPNWMIAGALFLGVWPLILFMDTRAELISYLAWAGTLYLIRAEYRTRRLWLLVPLTAIWAQMHGSFPLEWYALMVLAAGLWWTRQPELGSVFRRVLAVLFTSMMVTLMNPYGLSLWTYILHMLTNRWFVANINEWATPPFDQPIWMLTVLLPGIAIIWRFNHWWNRVPGILRLGLLLLTIQFMLHLRYYPYLYIAGWSALWWVPPQWPSSDEGSVDWNPSQWIGLFIVGSLVAGTVLLPGPQFRRQNAWDSAVAWLVRHPHPRLINGPNIGGDLIAAGIHPFVDGRADIYTRLPMTWKNPEILVQTIFELQPGFYRAWYYVHPQTIIDVPNQPVNLWLHEHHWREVVHDTDLTVWVAPGSLLRYKQ